MMFDKLPRSKFETASRESLVNLLYMMPRRTKPAKYWLTAMTWKALLLNWSLAKKAMTIAHPQITPSHHSAVGSPTQAMYNLIQIGIEISKTTPNVANITVF